MSLLASVFMLSMLFPSSQPKMSGEELIKAMHDRYSSTWYKTLTFTQQTITHRPDGSKNEATWYEYMSIPSRLRIDIAPVDSGNAMLFARDTIFVYRRGALVNRQPLIHSLLVLGFDVYHTPVEETVRKLKELHYDLTVVREDVWQGRPVYVVGAQKDDLNTKQFWIDKERLVFVRSLEPNPRDASVTSEVQFNKYEKLGGGWISPYVLFSVGGRTTMEEIYTDMKINVKIDEKMFEVK